MASIYFHRPALGSDFVREAHNIDFWLGSNIIWVLITPLPVTVSTGQVNYALCPWLFPSINGNNNTCLMVRCWGGNELTFVLHLKQCMASGDISGCWLLLVLLLYTLLSLRKALHFSLGNLMAAMAVPPSFRTTVTFVPGNTSPLPRNTFLHARI